MNPMTSFEVSLEIVVSLSEDLLGICSVETAITPCYLWQKFKFK